ncbi:MAG TPA: sigma-70 family RNA polymerase sigma factor [Pirellulales bacterium]|jgi:RNA polymerase sigma-70 factor (ECF subfamily)|nr:sigma-70 family RNA polymerase sigma factor [Pirellulales bacterium]
MADAKPDSADEWLRSIVATYEGPLVRYAARITGDVERARDVVQDTFLRLCRQDRAKLDGRLAEWLYTVCRRRALDVERKEHRMRTSLSEPIESCQAREPGHAETLESRDEHAEALRVLGTLPANQQEVVRLKFQSGLAYREIAAITGLSVSNVGYLLHVALKRIREQIGDEK